MTTTTTIAPHHPHPTLSPRKIEILQLAADDRDTFEIAANLGLSPNTIKTHKKQILERLYVGSMAAAVATAIRSGVIR